MVPTKGAEMSMTNEQLQEIVDTPEKYMLDDYREMATDLLASRARVVELEGMNNALQELNATLRQGFLPQTLEVKRLTAQLAEAREWRERVIEAISEAIGDNTQEVVTFSGRVFLNVPETTFFTIRALIGEVQHD
jgi:hypothetical protein